MEVACDEPSSDNLVLLFFFLTEDRVLCPRFCFLAKLINWAPPLVPVWKKVLQQFLLNWAPSRRWWFDIVFGVNLVQGHPEIWAWLGSIFVEIGNTKFSLVSWLERLLLTDYHGWAQMIETQALHFESEHTENMFWNFGFTWAMCLCMSCTVVHPTHGVLMLVRIENMFVCKNVFQPWSPISAPFSSLSMKAMDSTCVKT